MGSSSYLQLLLDGYSTSTLFFLALAASMPHMILVVFTLGEYEAWEQDKVSPYST